jgi:hypothetical protein
MSDTATRSLTERGTLLALESSAEFYTLQLAGEPSAEDRAHWGRELRAVNKAALHYLAGLRPEQTIGSRWLVPSATRGGAVHQVIGGACSCEAGQHGAPCWHAALVAAVETGLDTIAIIDDEPDYDDADAARDTYTEVTL